MRARHAVAVVPLAAALLLAGCSGRPGTAATVDGTRITDGQVASLLSDLAIINGSDTATPRQAVQSLIIAPTVLDVAADAGMGVSRQQGIDLLDDAAAQIGADPWDYSDELVEIAQMAVATNQLDTDANTEVQARVEDLDVRVNPRFGSWDSSGVTATTWPWILGAADSSTSAG